MGSCRKGHMAVLSDDAVGAGTRPSHTGKPGEHNG